MISSNYQDGLNEAISLYKEQEGGQSKLLPMKMHGIKRDHLAASVV